jgi:hypothetical protein
MKQFFKNYSGVFLTLLFFVVFATPALAGPYFPPTTSSGSGANTQSGTGVGTQSGSGFGTQSGSGQNVTTGGKVVTLDNPLGAGNNSVCKLVVGLLKAALVIGIPIAILFIVWAGLQFVLAQGKPDKLTKARENFLNVIIGIAIFVGSSLIASVIVNTLQQLGVQGINSC